MDIKEQENLSGSKKKSEPSLLSHQKVFVQRGFSYHSYIKDSENIQRIKHFIKCIKDESIPDDETLIWLADSFQKYVQESCYSLESAFGLKTKPKKGNSAQQYNSDMNMNNLLMEMAKTVVEDDKISQEKAAEIVLKNKENINFDASTLARYFRDWHNKENAIQLYQIHKRMK